MRERIDRRAGIAWLARSQGYSKTQLQNALQEGDMAKPKGFLESMRVELANLPSRMSTVTFLVQMTLEQLISVNAALRKYERKMRRRHMTNEAFGLRIRGSGQGDNDRAFQQCH